MTEETHGRAGTDPTELWRQWYETGAKVWSDVFKSARESYVDPYGVYRQWFDGMEEMRDRMIGAGTGDATNPMAAVPTSAAAMAGMSPRQAQNLWSQWFEATAESWRRAAGLGEELANLTPRWLETLEQARDNFLAGGDLPTDPLQFVTRWYNATSGPFSELIGDLIEREEFLDQGSRFLQNYASFYKVFRRNSEEYLRNLQLPARSDITRVAGLVVALEDKIDRIEEAFEDFEYGYAKPATEESMQALENRMDGLDRKLDQIAESGSADAETVATAEAVEGLERRLDAVDGKLDEAAAGSATAESVRSLEGRLDGVEAKIDRLLAALESTPQDGGAQVTEAETTSEEANGSAEAAGGVSEATTEEVRATAAARRRAEELGVDLAEVEGTGANGQITVDDVRKKGES